MRRGIDRNRKNREKMTVFRVERFDVSPFVNNTPLRSPLRFPLIYHPALVALALKHDFDRDKTLVEIMPQKYANSSSRRSDGTSLRSNLTPYWRQIQVESSQDTNSR